MYNDIQIGPVTLHMYGLMVAIGFVAAYLISVKRAEKKGLKPAMMDIILACSVIGGFLGSRLLFYLVNLSDVIADPSMIWNFANGYVVYGGIIGGVSATMLYCHWKKEPFLAYFDLVTPSLALAQGFGRIGCFFAGCCYGRETTSPLGIAFSHSAFAPNGVKLIPTQLISSAGDFGIAAILYCYAKKQRATGKVAALYMMLYSAGRFGIEFLRADFRGNIGLFSTSQLIAVLIFLAGMVLFGFRSQKVETSKNKLS